VGSEGIERQGSSRRTIRGARVGVQRLEWVELAAVPADNRNMEIRIHRGRCCGSAQCVETAPLVFVLDDRGKAVVIDPEAATFELLLEVAESCPSQAIEVEDDEDARFP